MKKRKELQKFLLNFTKCGVAGWCMEIIFTSMGSVLSGDFRLMGHTSLLMFPIYGLGALLGPISGLVDWWLEDPAAEAEMPVRRKDRIWRHGINDMVLIFTAEYVTGFLLRALGVCPWDYSGRFFSVDGLIRLDFAPFWFGAGLLFEMITKEFPPAKPAGMGQKTVKGW